ncbi:TPA: hypothetical protein ACGOZH_001830 [Streptococcus suis]
MEEWESYQEKEFEAITLSNSKTEIEIKNLKSQHGQTELERNEYQKDKTNGGIYVEFTADFILKIENFILKKVTEELSVTHEIIEGFKLESNNNVIDIVAVSKNLFQKDYLYEIKYSKGEISQDFLKNTVIKLNNKSKKYTEITNKIANKIIYIVTDEKNISKNEEIIAVFKKKNSDKRLSIELISQDNIN